MTPETRSQVEPQAANYVLNNPDTSDELKAIALIDALSPIHESLVQYTTLVANLIMLLRDHAGTGATPIPNPSGLIIPPNSLIPGDCPGAEANQTTSLLTLAPNLTTI